MTISFLSHECAQPVENKTELKRWLQAVAKSENRLIDTLSYIFTTDEFLYHLNKQYLKHNTLTDIITFDYSENKRITGDIFISVERVKENSQKFKCTFDDELHRVMVHGLLHLAGYSDKTKSAQSVMRKKENAALARLPF